MPAARSSHAAGGMICESYSTVQLRASLFMEIFRNPSVFSSRSNNAVASSNGIPRSCTAAKSIFSRSRPGMWCAIRQEAMSG